MARKVRPHCVAFLICSFLGSIEWAVLTLTAAILVASLALHFNLRPYKAKINHRFFVFKLHLGALPAPGYTQRSVQTPFLSIPQIPLTSDHGPSCPRLAIRARQQQSTSLISARVLVKDRARSRPRCRRVVRDLPV